MMLLVAFYFAIMLPDREYPKLIGHYTEWSECDYVRGWLDRRGYETAPCTLMPFPQEAVHLEILELPLED